VHALGHRQHEVIRQLASATLGSASWINGLVSLVLFALALVLVVYARRAWRQPLVA
jgi:hypothetical protein